MNIHIKQLQKHNLNKSAQTYKYLPNTNSIHIVRKFELKDNKHNNSNNNNKKKQKNKKTTTTKQINNITTNIYSYVLLTHNLPYFWNKLDFKWNKLL